MSAINFHQSRNTPHTHSACDEQERYYFTLPEGWTVEQAAADFQSGYAVFESGTVAAWIEDAEGNCVHSFSFYAEAEE